MQTMLLVITLIYRAFWWFALVQTIAAYLEYKDEISQSMLQFLSQFFFQCLNWKQDSNLWVDSIGQRSSREDLRKNTDSLSTNWRYLLISLSPVVHPNSRFKLQNNHSYLKPSQIEKLMVCFSINKTICNAVRLRGNEHDATGVSALIGPVTANSVESARCRFQKPGLLVCPGGLRAYRRDFSCELLVCWYFYFQELS